MRKKREMGESQMRRIRFTKKINRKEDHKKHKLALCLEGRGLPIYNLAGGGGGSAENSKNYRKLNLMDPLLLHVLASRYV
jgi:hypothetical protein